MSQRYLQRSFDSPKVRCMLVAAFILVLSLVPARGQSRWIESNVGLEGAHAAALGFDSTGRALVGTACGLYRLEANRWSVVLDRDSVSALVASSKGTLLAGTMSGLWRGTPDASEWTRVHEGINTSAIVALGGDSILAIVGAKLHRSVDDGVTWTPVDNLPQSAAGRLAIARDGRIYAWRSGIYRSSDHGATWQSITQGVSMSLMVPISGDRLLGVYADSLYESTDAGRGWTSVRELPSNDLRLGSDGRVLAAVGLPRLQSTTPSTAPGAYELGDDGSIGALLRPGLSHLIADGPGGRLIIGANPDLHLSSDGAASWELVDAGLDCAILSNITIDRAGRMYGVLKGIRWITEPYSLGALHRSLDSGRTWRRLTDGVVAILGAFASGEVLVSARDSIGAQVVRASSDHGNTWSSLPTPPAIPYVSGNDSGSVALSFTWNSSSAGDTMSQLWLSRDTARTWSMRATGRRASAVLATGDALFLVGAVGTSGDDVYRSSDDGATWISVINTQLTTSIQNAPDGDIFAVIGTEFSVKRSTDRGQTFAFRGRLPGNFRTPLILASSGDLFVISLFVPNAIARSTNDGVDWALVDVPWTETVGVTVLADGRLIGVASDPTGVRVWESRDGGTSWRAATYPALATPSLRVAPWGELFAGVGPQRLLRLGGALSSVSIEPAMVSGVTVNAAPIPARDVVRLAIALDTPSEVLISLHSVDGACRIGPIRHRLAAGDNAIALDLGELPPGLYVARVATPHGTVSERIVVR